MENPIRSKLLLGVGALLLVGAYLFFSGRLGKNPQVQGSATISGVVDYNGTIPQGTTISVSAKKIGDNKFVSVVEGVTAADQITWSWGKAEAGTAYQLQAYAKSDGKVIAESDTIAVAAPASDEVLEINSTVSPTDTASTISGIVNMNGSVPTGSTIAIAEKLKDETQFNIVLTGLPATDGTKWSWNGAKEGTLYEIKAFLQVNGANLYESRTERVAAPAANEILTLNARTANPTPTPQTTPSPAVISGSINFNGNVPSGANISIAQRVSGQSQFNVVLSNISANNGSSWSWSGAQSGVSYDVQASLIVNGTTVIQSPVLTVTAPAANEVLTLNNAQNNLPPPPANSMTNTCNGKNPSSNLWQVTLTYNNNQVIKNAVQYWVTLGTNTGGSQYVNSVTTPNNPSQTQSYSTGYVLTEGVTYYAQYAYSLCNGCNIFSQFSPSMQLYCTTSVPTNTPSPTSTPTPSPTNTPTPTPSPTPQLSPTGLLY